MRIYIYRFVFAVTAFLLASCSHDPLDRTDGQKISSPLTEPSEHYKIGTPYVIKGKKYYPHEDYNYEETGMASWYGDFDHGDLTANGEIFDENIMTAAHRTLPLPSIVKVTNLSNGKSLIVRVNDRGPFARNRIIDLSKKAAEELGFKNQGTAKVHVKILVDESLKLKEASQKRGVHLAQAAPKKVTPTPEASVPTTKDIQIVSPLQQGYFIQIASFRAYKNAEDLVKKLSSNYENLTVYEVNLKGTLFYRVVVGPLTTRNAALEKQRQLLKNGFQTQIIFQPQRGV